jgi:hypothetical protein
MYYIKYLDMFRAILCSSSGGRNCISTASGIVTLCERPCSTPIESGLQELCNKLVIKTDNKYVCIPRSILVKNVYNQGKTLCSPCIFISMDAMKVCRDWKVERCLISSADGNKRSTSRHRRFTPQRVSFRYLLKENPDGPRNRF